MIKLPDKCLRGLNDCEPYAQIESTCGGSFVCFGENDGTGRVEEQDKYTFCFKNSAVDEINHFDEVDTADHASVLVQGLSVINHIRNNEDDQNTE